MIQPNRVVDFAMFHALVVATAPMGVTVNAEP